MKPAAALALMLLFGSLAAPPVGGSVAATARMACCADGGTMACCATSAECSVRNCIPQAASIAAMAVPPMSRPVATLLKTPESSARLERPEPAPRTSLARDLVDPPPRA